MAATATITGDHSTTTVATFGSGLHARTAARCDASDAPGSPQ